ncbi:MAG: RsmB/NOP family class I SAM-dependent RNA methyltransferase [Dehalococcoidia bacterium]|nr:RsmB/NOP family class I SAM-dependent RNA methyltransferase [Dehalococcoidia bacterium]
MEETNQLRYRSIIEDWDAFQKAAETPMPYVVRSNTLKIESSVLYRRFIAAGIDVTRYEWNGDLFELAEPPGRRIEHWLGLYYAQEAVQTLPVMALDPQPGETALDLCAAPGGKATYIAARMQNRGTLVANEPSGRRQMSLLANVNRLGVLNTMVTAYQGENFPMQTSFDRILVDAPCSAEGTLRKEPSLRNGASSGTIARLARLQKRLILRAFDLLAESGLLVYSTCTFAPEENEAVVAHLLQERDAQILPFSIPIEASSGLLGWQGETFPEQTKHCVRVYPHHLNSGGGFLARITRA